MKTVVRHKGVVRFPIYKMQRTDLPSGGYTLTRVFSHYEEADVELEYDVDFAFKEVGVKAGRSRGGRSRAANGIVIAKRIGKPRKSLEQ